MFPSGWGGWRGGCSAVHPQPAEELYKRWGGDQEDGKFVAELKEAADARRPRGFFEENDGWVFELRASGPQGQGEGGGFEPGPAGVFEPSLLPSAHVEPDVSGSWKTVFL